jgi:WD40 repeat protein
MLSGRGHTTSVAQIDYRTGYQFSFSGFGSAPFTGAALSAGPLYMCAPRALGLVPSRVFMLYRGNNRVAVTADGKRAVSASEDKTLKVWDLDSGGLLATFTCDGASYSCAFINDHKLIAGGADGRIYFLKFEQSKRKK